MAPSAPFRRSIAAGLCAVAALLTPSPPLRADDEPAKPQTVEVPVALLEQIQAELRDLRQRDAELRAWAESLEQRLEAGQGHPARPAPSMPPPTSTLADLAPIDPEMATMAPGLASPPGIEDTSIDPAGSCSDCHHSPCSCLVQPPAPPDGPAVTSLGKYVNVRVFGAVKLDMLFNSARPIAPGIPFFLAPGTLNDADQRSVDIHARQTMLGASFEGPRVGAFQVGGLFSALLFEDSLILDRYGLLPLQAYGDMTSEDWRIAAGLQFDVFAPNLPTVLPFSFLVGSGNAGNSFRGQLRLERFFHPSNDVEWKLQTALSEPITTTIDPIYRLNEDNGWPNVEARLALGLGASEQIGLARSRPFEIGLSGVVGQIRTTPLAPATPVIADVYGLSADLRWRINHTWGVSAEGYVGQTLGTYNGAILQNINFDTLQGIRSRGGWFEVYAYLTPRLHTHHGFGLDDPLDRDVSPTERTYNSTYFSNLIWDINHALRVAFELTYRQTHYQSPSLLDNHGPGFHTQFQWSF